MFNSRNSSDVRCSLCSHLSCVLYVVIYHVLDVLYVVIYHVLDVLYVVIYHVLIHLSL